MVLEVRGTVLPQREEKVLWVDGDRWTTEPRTGAEVVVDGGWLVPGLVDVHTHLGSEKPGDRFDQDLAIMHLIDHRDAGVLLVRTPGSADLDSRRRQDHADLPHVVPGGRWLASPGTFFPGYGRDVTYASLAEAAVEEALASGGWCKIIGDWLPGVPVVPLDALTEAVAAVHAVGGRVAVHCQTPEGSRNAVLAGADSLEHGMYLDRDLLPRMAASGTALVPTFTTFAKTLDALSSGGPAHIRDWLRDGWESLVSVVPAAHEAGVLVLAGTDCTPCGSVVDEVEWLVDAGLPTTAAVAAASWAAREWLGLPGFVDGAPADLVAYDTDPTRDPAVLRSPRRIMLRGRVIR